MKPFYNRANTNFGDHMNSWLWPELIPNLIDEDDTTRLIGIGSLLSRNLDLVPGEKIIFGTGSGYSSLPTPEQAAKWQIFCVRGPLTCRHLGLDPSKSITDGAWLINQIPRYATIPSEKTGTVFVPHHTSAELGAWAKVCTSAGLKYIDPLSDCHDVFMAIATAELAIVESLHGAIIADYFRTPWIPVASPRRVLKFKWLDWCGSLNLPYRPYHLPPSDGLDCRLQKVSHQDISYEPLKISVPGDTFDVPRTNPPPSRADLLYRGKMHGKAVARNLRQRTFNAVSNMRNGLFFSSWNAQHTENMTAFFAKLRQEKPMLSSHADYQQRISQLNDAFDRMRAHLS